MSKCFGGWITIQIIGTNIALSCIYLNLRDEADGLVCKHLTEGIKKAIEEVQNRPSKRPKSLQRRKARRHSGQSKMYMLDHSDVLTLDHSLRSYVHQTIVAEGHEEEK